MPGIQVKTYNLEPDFGLESALGSTIGGPSVGPVWQFQTYTGVEVLDGSFTADLGLNFVLGDELVGGGPVDPTVWNFGTDPLPTFVPETEHFLLGTEFGEYVSTEDGILIEVK